VVNNCHFKINLTADPTTMYKFNWSTYCTIANGHSETMFQCWKTHLSIIFNPEKFLLFSFVVFCCCCLLRETCKIRITNYLPVGSWGLRITNYQLVGSRLFEYPTTNYLSNWRFFRFLSISKIEPFLVLGEHSAFIFLRDSK
jgi:hypothetical protein